jgi:hypothetical protein
MPSIRLLDGTRARVMAWSGRASGAEGGRMVKPCYLVAFAAGMPRSGRPGTGCEVGRKKPRNFQCLSKLSNLSNQIRRRKGESFSAPAESVERRRRPLSLPAEDLLAGPGQVDLAGHGPVVQGLILVRERYAVSQIAARLTRGVRSHPTLSSAPIRHEVVGSCHTLCQRDDL